MNKEEILNQFKEKYSNLLFSIDKHFAPNANSRLEKELYDFLDKALTQYSNTLRGEIEGMKKEMVSVQESDEDYNRHGNRELTRGWNHIRTGYNQALQDVVTLLSPESDKK